MIHEVNIYPLPEIELFFENLCHEQSTNLSAEVNIPVGYINSNHWEVDNNVFFNTYNVNHTFSGTGEFPIYYEAISDFGCVSNALNQLTIFSNPNIDFSISSDTICEDDLIFLNNYSTPSNGSEQSEITWDINNLFHSENDTTSFQFPNAGNYDLSLTITDELGCSSDTLLSNFITVNPRPIADFYFSTDSPLIYEPEIEVYDASYGANTWRYTNSWEEIYHDQNPTISLSNFDELIVTQCVINEFGCVDSITKMIYIEPSFQVYIPNSFTPDNNGLNEGFSPSVHGADIHNYHFMIFDRWGEIVFESYDSKEKWFGNIKAGNHYPHSNVFNYILTLQTKGTDKIYKGHVNLIR